jgi:dienelactone hydrolase
VLRHPAPAAVVLLWHGRGPNEARVLRRLATALHSDGHTVVIPDWDAGSQDGGAAVLRASLDHGLASTDGRPSVPLVLAGWSLGGTAALSLALSDVSSHDVAAVVGLGAATRERSPLDGTLPLERVRPQLGMPRLYLVHGLQDAIVPPSDGEAFATACVVAGVPCALTLVESDHAGVVGTEYDPTAGICVPSESPAATRGLDAARQTIRAAVREL